MNTEAENEKIPEIPSQEQNLRVQLLDYLFDRGHKVSKPLIHAVAHFTYDYGQALYEQGKMKGRQEADQPRKDGDEDS